MRLIQITSDQWTILAAKSDRGDCPLLDFLNGIDRSLEIHRDKMLALLHEVSEKHELPNQWIHSSKCHTITNDKQIWQFSVGSLRVAWFFDKDRIIVCTHGFYKSGQKTKKSDQQAALKAREEYFKAKFSKEINIEVE